jgi:uncharacterized membrane protein (DUF106 family)
MWLYIEWMNPPIMFFYPVCDWVLKWTTHFGGVWGVVIVGTITGLAVNLFQKFFSKQKLLGKCKADLDKLKKGMADAKKEGDDEKHLRLMNVSKRVSGKYMWGSLKPALWTVPPVIVVVMWTGSRLGYEPVQPKQEVEVIACFENEANGFCHIIPSSDDLEVVGPPICRIEKGHETDLMIKKRHRLAAKGMGDRWYKVWTWFSEPSEEQKKGWIDASPAPPIGLECHWKLRPRAPGDYKVTIRYPTAEGFKSAELDFPVHQGEGRPPEFINLLLWDTPTMDHMQSVQFDIEDSMMPAWWNLCFQWMGLYVVLAIVFGVAFRFILRVN